MKFSTIAFVASTVSAVHQVSMTVTEGCHLRDGYCACTGDVLNDEITIQGMHDWTAWVDGEFAEHGFNWRTPVTFAVDHQYKVDSLAFQVNKGEDKLRGGFLVEVGGHPAQAEWILCTGEEPPTDWRENTFDDREWVHPQQVTYVWNDSEMDEEKQRMAEERGHSGWLWLENDQADHVYCRMNQVDYEERVEDDQEGFRVCNRISSQEDGDHQYSAFFAYDKYDTMPIDDEPVVGHPADTTAVTNLPETAVEETQTSTGLTDSAGHPIEEVTDATTGTDSAGNAVVDNTASTDSATNDASAVAGTDAASASGSVSFA